MNDSPTIDDLEGIDYSTVKSLDMIRTIDDAGCAGELDLEFTVHTSDDRDIDLIPNGSQIAVTYEDRHKYCDLVIQVW